MRKKKLFLLISIPILVSCADDGFPDDRKEAPVDAIYGAATTRVIAEGISEDDKDLIIIDSFDGNSILYFSQLGTTLDPNFDPEVQDESKPYCYRYNYVLESGANWDKGYNFKKIDETEAFDWDRVPTIGSVGNAFSFYAMHFPVNNTVRWDVETDQSNLNNFQCSDIMGAYHATSSAYTRMRFRLFHLMVYLHVRLYVPVYREEVNNDNYNYSGFEAGAVEGAYILNAYTGFNIEWRTNRTSDTMAPLTTASGDKEHIKVLAHEPNNDESFELYVKHYYDKGDLEFDEVREYHFSVIFPSQEFGDNFLCFALRDKNNALRYFYFSGKQVLGDGSNYSLSQGTLQQLSLYLPRYTNETILIGANILPWNNSVTDMTVSKDEPTTDNK